jgi:hypothetical protein
MYAMQLKEKNDSVVARAALFHPKQSPILLHYFLKNALSLSHNDAQKKTRPRRIGFGAGYF